MTWEELKETCDKYGINLDKCRNGIYFKDLPFAKGYFKRRPIYKVFDIPLCVHEGKIENVSRGIFDGIKAPLIYYKPVDNKEMLRDYKIDEFMMKGGIPTTFFRSWCSSRTGIYTVKDFEEAIEHFKLQLEKLDKVNKSISLSRLTEEYKEKEKEHAELWNEMEGLKKKYRQLFKKEYGIVEDF